MSKEGSRLGRLSVLAPAALSACMDASVLAVPAAGAIVSTIIKELSKAFMLKKWFHGVMSAKETEVLMMEKGKNGSFLVRESKTHPGELVLSVRVQGRITHVMIKKEDNKYNVGNGEQFEDLVGLIEHFRRFPMVENSGAVLRLLQPLGGGAGAARTRRAHDSAAPHLDTTYISTPELENYGVNDGVRGGGGGGGSGSEDCAGVDGEFVALQLGDARADLTTRHALSPHNLAKNRYKNILPYDQTRVVLRGAEGADYINASYIRADAPWDHCSSVESSNESLHTSKSLSPKVKRKSPLPLVSKSLSDDALREIRRCIKMDKINCNYPQTQGDKLYIATQGCLPNTKADFWRMVWQEDARLILMLTNENENGKKKCERYWPSSGQEETYHKITVTGISEKKLPNYFVREFTVSDQNKTRTVFQYQFTCWPDHGAPESTASVLALVEDVNCRAAHIMAAKDRPEKKVICVHCSAGVGRTGTFIVLDMLLDKLQALEGRCGVDVTGAVRLARAQRSGMVQSRAQFRFIHRVIKDFLNKRLQNIKERTINSNI